MSVELEKYVQEEFRNVPEWGEASELADRLHEHLNTESIQSRLEEANQPGQSSVKVQTVFLDFALSLGFESEKKGLFLDAALRPDYYRPLGTTGILLEVERGKTTINNMDLFDFWKCHLCPQADYLFLLVPSALRQNSRMSPRNEFATVNRRLAQFFEPNNYTNVRGLCLFGY